MQLARLACQKNAVLEIRLPYPDYLDHAAEISAGRRHFASTMLLKGQNLCCCRDLGPKMVLRDVPRMLEHANHRP